MTWVTWVFMTHVKDLCHKVSSVDQFHFQFTGISCMKHLPTQLLVQHMNEKMLIFSSNI